MRTSNNSEDFTIKNTIDTNIKVVFVIERLSNGGAERITAVLANGLSRKENIKVYVLTYIKENAEYQVYQNVTKVSFEKKNRGRVISLMKRIKWLKQKINEICPHFVISLGMPKTQILLQNIFAKRNFKLILSERNNPVVLPEQWAYRVLIKAAYMWADGVVFQTNDAMNYFSKRIKKHSIVISNPIIGRLPYKSSKYEEVIVNYCRLTSQKNIHCLLRAFAIVHKKYPTYRLVIYGSGELLEELINYAKVLNIDKATKFEGFNNEIHELIKNYSIFVSSSDYEGISNSMLEAMAIGLPVVCTDCPIGGARMVINSGENGLLVPVNDEREMAKAILSLIEDKNLAQKLGNNAKKVRDQFSIDIICDQWYKFMLRI